LLAASLGGADGLPEGEIDMPDPTETADVIVVGGSSAVNATVALRARPADLAKWGEHGAEGWSLDDAYHGRTGPLPIRQRTDGELTPSLRGFVEAAVAQGFKRVSDFNGAEQDGADGYPVDVVDGVRQNVGLVYLTEQVRRRPNLTIRGDVNIDRVLFDGATATGVIAADGAVYRGREIILSGGTYGSPAILLRSGVGPAEMTPAVGSLLWTASSEAAGDELDLHVAATHLMDGSLSPTGGAIVLLGAVTQPESTGTLTLASRDPGDAPLIDARYLGTARDARRLLEAVKISRAIARNPAFAPLIAANPAVYGHPTSTAPMGGPGEPWAVVDSVGAVNGVSGLRVVDASIIPEVLSATNNVTVIMLAERIYQRVYAS
jgi:choline dehydrogenase